VSRRSRRDITRKQVAIEMTWSLLLANDSRPKTTPNVGVELVQRRQSIFLRAVGIRLTCQTRFVTAPCFMPTTLITIQNFTLARGA